MPPSLADRVRGAVLGAAIGDALGHPTEFLGSFEEIRRRYPPAGVTGFALHWERDGRRFAPYTDDTQMAEVVLRSLVESRAAGADLDTTMRLIAERFVEWSRQPQGGHRAPGTACMAGCLALERGVHWSEAGGETAGGCGSVMRAYPFGILDWRDPDRAVHWAVEHSRLTHRDPIALAACAGMARAMALAMQGADVDAILGAAEEAARPFSAPTAEMIARAVTEARDGTHPEVTLSRLEGWAAHEAIAAAAYVVARHPDDLRAALLEAANTPGDSDSIATLAGAILGARLGAGALPEAWIREVERTEELRALADEAAALIA